MEEPKRWTFTIEAVKHHHDPDQAPLYSIVLRAGDGDYRLIVERVRLDGNVWKEASGIPTRQAAIDLEPGFVKEAAAHVCDNSCARWQTA
jgi:hypothetical protein